MSDAYVGYGLLLERFLNREISVEEFQARYLERFKNEPRQLPEPLFELLDGLFGDVDAFSSDSELIAENPGFYLDEAGLRERVRAVATRLSTYVQLTFGHRLRKTRTLPGGGDIVPKLSKMRRLCRGTGSELPTVIVKLVVAFDDLVMRPGGGCRS